MKKARVITHFIKIKKYFHDFFITQTAVTIIALPITTAWGLAFSIGSPLGNFIFSPLLTIFLLMCSLLFFTTLLGIPNTALCFCLNKFADFWYWLLYSGTKSWLIGFINPPFWLFLFFSIVVYCIVFYGLKRYRLPHLALLSIVLSTEFCFFYGYTSYSRPQQTQVIKLKNNKGSLMILAHPDKTLTLYDYDYFKGKITPEKMISYELRPYLLKTFGTTTIRAVHFITASRATFFAGKALALVCTVKKFHFPYFTHTLKKSDWRAFFDGKNTVIDEGSTWLRYKVKNSKNLTRTLRSHHKIRH